jgi:DNA invertase Pin-like site-specific DNA recombinase
MSRVSSDEQAKGFSLGVQYEQLTNYCKRKDIEVVAHYKEDHSAKDFNRPEFQNFLRFAKKNKNTIDYLLVTTWDRFSRNVTDSFVMIRRLRTMGIEVQAIEQPIDFKVPESKAMLALNLVLPEIDNDRRSIKIRGGIRGSLKAGRWCRMAPMGYLNRRDDNNKPIIIPGPKAKFIQYAFKGIIKGKTQAVIREELNNKGFKVSRNNFYNSSCSHNNFL